MSVDRKGEWRGAPVVVDFRSRPNTANYLKTLESPQIRRLIRVLDLQPASAASLEEYVGSLAESGIDRVVFTGRDSVETRGFDVTNEYVADCAAKSDRIIGFAGISCESAEQGVRAVHEAIEGLGLVGVSIDPFGCRKAPDDPSIYPIYAACAQLDVPVVITTGPLPFAGPTLDHGSVRSVDRVASDFPSLSIVCDHTGWPWVTEIIATVLRHDNVYLDTSLYLGMPGIEPLADAIERFISDRVLFASAFPLVEVERARAEVNALPVSDSSAAKVFGGNARALLERHRAWK